MSPFLRGFAAACLSASLVAAAPSRAQTAPPFVETIDVREVEILFDTGVLPPFESLGQKGVEDFKAFENGAAHDLERMSAVPAEDWFHLCYFDPALASPEARVEAANALARRAERLAAGGTVAVVVADPRPRRLASTTDPLALARALGEVAAAAREEASKGSNGEIRGASVAERLRQLDRLVAEVGALGGGGPRALWLPVAGWPMTPRELERYVKAKKSGDPTEPVAAALLAAGRTLAGFGWITYPLALRAERQEISANPAEARARVEVGGSGDERTTVPLFTIPGSRHHPDAVSEAQLSALTDMSLLPVTELSRATSGTLVGHEQRLKSALADLLDRKRATYRGPRPRPGALLPIEVRWTGGDGRPIPAVRFLRSSTPPEVTAARLRLLLAGDAAPAAESISVREPDSAPREFCFGKSDEKAVRLSVAREKPDGTIELGIGEAITLKSKNGEPLCQLLETALSPTDRRLAWLAEDLDTETWTGGVGTASR